MSAKDGCLVHPTCVTCTFAKCLLEKSSKGDKEYMRFKVTTFLKKDLNLNWRLVGTIMGADRALNGP